MARSASPGKGGQKEGGLVTWERGNKGIVEQSKTILLWFARARGLTNDIFFLLIIGLEGLSSIYNTVLGNSYDNIL
jgi:hypothetical protein